MSLTTAEIIERVNQKTETNKQDLNSALKHERRLRFHGQTALDADDVKEATKDFMSFAAAFGLPAERLTQFERVLKESFPIDTVSIVGEAIKTLSKVFDGKDPNVTYEFTDRKQMDDFIDYRNELNLDEFWEKEAISIMTDRINSLIVVDMPDESTNNREPYFYSLSLDRVIDFETEDFSDKLKWIAFEQDDDKIAYIDTEYYRVFKAKGKSIEIGVEPLVENQHDFKYCPVDWFWSDYVTTEKKWVKKSPFTDQLSSLNWLLFYYLAKKISDLSGPWTMYWAYSEACEYELLIEGVASEEGIKYSCSRGLLTDGHGRYLVDSIHGGHKKCPSCSSKLIGPGVVLEVLPPQGDEKELREPAGIIPVDMNALEYNVSEVERLEKKFLHAVTGSNVSIDNKAINREQVASLYESGKTILMQFKRNLENSMTWLDCTLATARYGSGFKYCSHNLGTDFFIRTEDQMLSLYNDAKTAGNDDVTLDSLQDQYFETKYKNNDSQLSRVRMINALDDFRHYSKDEFKELRDTGLVSDEDYLFKIQLTANVRKFERDNGQISEFGKDAKNEEGELKTYGERVNDIRAIIETYISLPVKDSTNVGKEDN